jgi:hypothetical protein
MNLKLVTDTNIVSVLQTLSPKMAELVSVKFNAGTAVAVSEGGSVTFGATADRLRDATDAAEFTAFKAEAV